MRNKFTYSALLIIILHLLSFYLYADDKSPGADTPLVKYKTFTKSDINKLASVYLIDDIGSERPAIIDVDIDGDFDMLMFKDGNVEYHKNIGTLEKPEFVLENKNYDHYEVTPFISEGLPMPIFFADCDGDGDMDMFAVKDKGYNTETKKNDYRVLYAENAIDIDTGTLITIILILVIILLLLAILR
jgi:hypothetical protein